jgi:predicted transcriptional regulator
MTNSALVLHASEIVAAYLEQNQVQQSELPGLIRSVYGALNGLAEAATIEVAPMALVPAVPIKKSVTDEYIICLEDGAKLKMMKRYLRTHFDLTPDQYRAKWKLPSDYPIVAPNYAKFRSEMAKKNGLGNTAASGRGRKKRA